MSDDLGQTTQRVEVDRYNRSEALVRACEVASANPGFGVNRVLDMAEAFERYLDGKPRKPVE